MTTLVETALILLFIVAALVFVSWDIGTVFRKIERFAMVDDARRARRSEDVAWQNRHTEYEHAITLTLQRAELVTADRIVAALDRARTLEVVA